MKAWTFVKILFENIYGMDVSDWIDKISLEAGKIYVLREQIYLCRTLSYFRFW